MNGAQGTLFDERFLLEYAGPIMRDPKTALVELVANAWDAYATEVTIIWPDSNTSFSISDNGTGMTPDEFEQRWRTLAYDRISHQGK
ncbi:MAG: ATP-binding protein [Rhodospirillales bacterium]|nr:ATP-binding protein [Rhodospirillales bacterium]